MADRDILADARERFSLAHAAESENRRNALEDLKFARMGEQWPDAIKRARESEGRPCLTINRMPAFARQIVNDARQNRPAIKVRPADSNADPKTADIYNGLIRNIEQTSNAEVAYDTALESAVYGGFGYFRIRADYAHDDTFDLDILIERVANPFTVYGDPASQAADASDWRFGFVTDLVPLAEFKARYGKDAETAGWSSDGDDKNQLWHEDDAVRVAEYWDRSEVKRRIVLLSSGLVIEAKQFLANQAMWDAVGVSVVGEREVLGYKVTQYLLTGAEVLDTKAWSGQYIPIVPVYGDEVNVEGKRYFRGIVRDARDAQVMYNFWRTSSTELVALAPKAPWIGPKGSFDSDLGRWQTAHSKSHPFLEYDPQPGAPPPQRQPFAGVPAGAIQEALSSSDDLKSIIGIYDAGLGARSNETSGKAILARQREGDVSTFHYIDNLSRAIRYAGRVLLDLIPAVYDKPRMVRILGEDGAPKTVPVNGVQGPGGQLIPAERAREMDPHAHVYELARGKYDLVVEAGPSFSTRRDEASTFLLETIRANPATAPLLMDVIAKNMDFPEAETVARRFQAMLPPQIQQMEAQQDGNAPPEQVLMQQIQVLQGQLQQAQQMLQQADVQRTQLDAMKVQQDAQIEAQRLALQREIEDQKAALSKYEADLKAQVTLQVEAMRAEVQGQTQLRQLAADDQRAQAAASQQREAAGVPVLEQATQAILDGMAQMQAEFGQRIEAMGAAMNAPRELLRDPMTGRVVGVKVGDTIRQVARDESGRAVGLQ